MAVLIPPASEEAAILGLHGFMRGMVIIPDGVDLTSPVLDEPLDADRGEFHA